MTTLREAAEQALEALEYRDGDGADQWKADVITALRAALEKAAPQATPAWWRDGLTATLMREGINKHRAREIADGYWDAYCGIDGFEYE